MRLGWEIKRLGDLVDIRTGKIDANAMVEGGEYPFFTCSREIFTIDKYAFDCEAILLAGNNANGDFNVKHYKGKFNAYQRTYVITICDKNQLIYSYLNHHLINNLKALKEQSVGANTKFLKLGMIKEMSIPLPQISEQKHIVTFLDEAFASIAKAKVKAEQNLKNSRDLFESYLENIFINKGEDWEEKRLGEVCEFKSGTTIPISLERNDGDVLYVKVGDMNMSENQIEINTSSRFVNSNEINKNQIIPEGSIIFPKRGGAIATNKKRKIVKPTIVDLNTMALIPGKKVNKDFLFYWFQQIDLNDISNGTSIPQINNYSFDEVFISYPISLSTQQTIVKKLDTLSSKANKLETIYEEKLTDLEELKKSILQKALKGELIRM